MMDDMDHVDEVDRSMASMLSMSSMAIRFESGAPGRQKVSPTPSRYLTSVLPWSIAGEAS